MAIEYHYEDSQGLSTTTSQVWQEKVDLEIPVTSAGYYRISWWFAYRANSNQYEVAARVRLDDSVDFVSVEESGAKWKCLSGFRVYPLSVGTHSLKIEYMVVDEGGTAGIARATLDSWRASDA